MGKTIYRLMNRLAMILAVVMLVSARISAQTYPVTVQTIVTPPYPVSLEEFYAEGGTKLTVQVTTRDITLSHYPVKFRLVLTGRGITISTNPSFIPQPFYLEGGETQTLSGEDLAPYFDLTNLIFSGYSVNQYKKDGRLPEGAYTLRVEVLDYNRNVAVAGTIPAIMMLFENEPPLLNLPASQEVISALTTQNIMFNWSCRPTPFSSSSFVPEYKFDLWEIWPDEKDPYEIIRSTRPIYTNIVSTTNLLYTVNEPLLFVGRRYVWRVQVTDPQGVGKFKNDGYSEIRWFRYGKVCPKPVLTLDKTGIQNFIVKWNGDYRQTKYELRYREKKRKDAQWYTKTTTQLNVNVDNLKPNTEYEAQLLGYCDDQPGEYSDYLTVTTKPETKFECGVGPASPDLSNSKPLEQLTSRDFIKAGDFDIKVTEATGSNGTFSGKGVVLVPYLKFLKVEVTFRNIRVNDDYRLTDGVIYSVYNLENSLVLKTQTPDFLKVDLKKPVEENAFKKISRITIETDTTVKYFIFKKDVLEVTDSKGKITNVRVTDDQVVPINNNKDDGAPQYVADPKTKTMYSGQPETKGSTSNASSVTPQPKSTGTTYSVTFARHQQQDYGFDRPTDNTPAQNYESVTINGNTQLMPWKSILAGGFDRVKAKITGTPIDSVRFRRESQQLVMTAPGNADTVQLMLSGQGDMEEDDVYAWYPEYQKKNDSTIQQNRVLAGQMKTVSYQKLELTVNLVQVNGSVFPDKADEIEKYLNRVYAPALVHWTVKPVSGFRVRINGEETRKIGNTDPDDKMNYTPDMRTVIDAFTKTNYNSNEYYLFFFDEGTDMEKSGYMPFNKNFGFIIKYQNRLDAYLRTIAHELGHGAFRLYHTFSEKNKYVQSQGSTSNLMDYVDGSKAQTAINLQKYQWDEIHSWHVGANWLEGEEEGESVKKPQLKCISNASNLGKLFVDPSGGTIKLSVNQTPLAFFGQNEGDLYGRLAAYTQNGKVYIYYLKAYTNIYSGYYGDISLGDVSDASQLEPFTNISEKGKLVKISNNCKYDNTLLQSCNCNFSIDFSKSKKGKEYIPGGKPAKPSVEKIVSDLSDSEYNNLVTKLIARFNSQFNSKQYFTVDPSLEYNDRIDKFNLDDINDRFGVFNKETSDQIFVDVIKVNARPSADQIRKLAKEVYQKSTASQLTNIVYLVIPVWNEVHVTDGNGANVTVFSNTLYSENANYNSISQSTDFSAPANDVYANIKSIYKLVPKPLIEYYHFVRIDGLDISKRIERKERKAGEEHIYKLNFFYDKQIIDFLSIEKTYFLTKAKGNYDLNHYQDWSIQKGDFERAVIALNEWYKISLNERINNPNWVNGTSDLKEAYFIDHILKESYITGDNPQQYVNNYINWKFEGYIWKENIKEIESSAFFDPDYGEVIYTAIDAIGLVLSTVDLDFITDAGGAFYASYRGDLEQNISYMVSSAIPFVSAPLLKGLVKEGKVVLRYGDEIKVAEEIVETSMDVIRRNLPENLVKIFDHLSEAGMIVVRSESDDIIQFLDKEHKVIAEIAEESGEKVLKVADNGFLDKALSTSTRIDIDASVKVLDEDGNILSDIQIVKNSDGSVGFFDKTIGTIPANTTGQIFNKRPSSRILGKNLEVTGTTRPANTAAHHLVAGNDTRAFDARQVLIREGIDINDEVNGVFLPKNTNFAQPPKITHSIVHTDAYYKEINNRILSAAPGKVKEELMKIKNELLNGTFKYK